MTEEEVLRILKLVEESSFDFMELQVDDLKLTVSKKGAVDSANPSEPPDAAVATPPAQAAKTDPPQAKPEVAAVREGAVVIKAPMVGTFYSTPEPGAPPFVEVGAMVDEDTTVGLIEVMKVFSAVTSGVRGVIAELCVESGQFVEYGQTIFWVMPEKTSKTK
ncbi:MAG: biotin/lipoyl-containing protein [Candidatus Binatia bacterium]|nr:biotin/lipoyl-containing protein [Candidatus Binatia bacterium]